MNEKNMFKPTQDNVIIDDTRIIVSVGPDTIGIKVGQKAIIFSGDQQKKREAIKIGEKIFLVVSQDDIMAVKDIEEEPLQE